MKKIAIINQRYGMEVNGGSEYYTRLIAERLKKYYDVEILTTTALNYDTWYNYYPEGTSDINGIKVRRFTVKRPRNRIRFGLARRIKKYFGWLGTSIDKLWVNEQGPYSPDLINYIEEHAKEYDKFIFVTYLYYSTVMGIPKVLDKAILIPTAHDEPYIYYGIYKDMFQKVSGIVYLTEEEKRFVEKTFENENIPNTVAAVGIDISEEMQDAPSKQKEIAKFREKYHIDGDYIIYAGRVDTSKCCDEMLEFYQKYVEENACDLQLVIMGKSMLTIPEKHGIHYLGFVSDEDKMAGIAGAKYLWLPSKFESLSIALLEGLAFGVPGLVNGKCEVLKGHAVRSKAAFYYTNWKEFEQCMHKMCSCDEDEYKEMSRNAEQYVTENYCWESIEKRLVEVIER